MLRRCIILVLFLLSFVEYLNGQQNLNSALNSPYNTVYTHLFYLQDDSYQPEVAAQSLHPGLDSLAAIKLSIKLKQILDGKGFFVHMSRIPSDENYLDSLTQRNLFILFPKDLPEVYLEKINGKWYYSNETVSAIPDLYKSVYPFGADILVSWLPKEAQTKIFGIKIWQYIGIVLLILFSIILHFLLSWIIRLIFNTLEWTKVDLTETSSLIILKAARYLSMILILSLLRSITPILQLSIKYSEFIQKGLRITLSIFLLLFLLSILKFVMRRARVLADRTESKMDEQLLPIVSALIKIALIIICLFHILHLLDVNVTALIAGISIGGLALALAAQDTVKNLIGSVIIFLDKPFLVGDYIIGSGFEGTVEEVGFRTTRLRGIDTAIVNIPNANLVNEVQKNLGVRKMRMMAANLGLTYNTPPEKIEAFVQKLRQLIIEDEKINPETYYVYFTEFKDSSLNLMLRIYLLAETYQEELELKHKINLRILNLAEELGVSFAFPTTSLYIEQLPAKN